MSKCVCSKYPNNIPVLPRWSCGMEVVWQCRITVAGVGIGAISVVY